MSAALADSTFPTSSRPARATSSCPPPPPTRRMVCLAPRRVRRRGPTRRSRPPRGGPDPRRLLLAILVALVAAVPRSSGSSPSSAMTARRRGAWPALGLVLIAVAAIVLLALGRRALVLRRRLFLLRAPGPLRRLELRHFDSVSLEYLLIPHNGHLQIGGKLLYEALFALFGSSYLAFSVVAVAAVLACVALFFALARRRVGDPLALLGAILLAFLGAAWEVLLWPFRHAHNSRLGGRPRRAARARVGGAPGRPAHLRSARHLLLLYRSWARLRRGGRRRGRARTRMRDDGSGSPAVPAVLSSHLVRVGSPLRLCRQPCRPRRRSSPRSSAPPARSPRR